MTTKKQSEAQDEKVNVSPWHGLKGKQLPWLRAYLDESNPSTFLNKTESTRKAGYNCASEDSLRSIGCQNFTKLTGRISAWLNEHGLSENTLKIKLLSLMTAKETKFQKIKGAVSTDDLPSGVSRVITSGSQEGGLEYGDGETLLAIETESIEIQRRTLDMALKVKGLYAPDKVEVTNLADLAGRLNEAHKRAGEK